MLELAWFHYIVVRITSDGAFVTCRGFCTLCLIKEHNSTAIPS